MGKKSNIELEKTFVMIKPDGIARGIVGKIFQRFEEQGLKLVAARMIKATKEQIAKHYPGEDKEWLRGVGGKTIANYDGDLKRLKKDFNATKALEIGKIVYDNFSKYLCKGPVIISVWEGNRAIERVRKLAGHAVPTFSEVGTIRGMYAFDTPELAIKAGRIVFKNLLHISDSQREADREIKLWFGDKYKDLNEYERIDYIDMF